MDSELPVFDMSRRGYCLIATLKFGDHPPPFDAGLPALVSDYEQVLIQLGFDSGRITKLQNSSPDAVTKELEQLGRDTDHSQVDCLIVVLICQHGFRLVPPTGVALTNYSSVQAQDDYRYGYPFPYPYGRPGDGDGGPRDEPLQGQLRLWDLLNLFKPEACPSLADKPKLFFVHSPRELQRLETRWRMPPRHYLGTLFGRQRVEQYVAATRCPEVRVGREFYVLYAPLPFYAGAEVPNPPAEMVRAMRAAVSRGRFDLNDLTTSFMSAVARSRSAEVAMPKAFSTLTKLMQFSLRDRHSLDQSLMSGEAVYSTTSAPKLCVIMRDNPRVRIQPLRDAFDALQFERIERNLASGETDHEVVQYLDRLAADTSYKDHCCLVVAMAGFYNATDGCGVNVSGLDINFDRLIRPFAQSPLWHGVSKLFIVQYENEAAMANSTLCCDTSRTRVDAADAAINGLPAFSDTALVMGYGGPEFNAILCDTLTRFGSRLEFQQLATLLNRRIALRPNLAGDDQAPMASGFATQLTKLLFLASM